MGAIYATCTPVSVVFVGLKRKVHTDNSPVCPSDSVAVLLWSFRQLGDEVRSWLVDASAIGRGKSNETVGFLTVL